MRIFLIRIYNGGENNGIFKSIGRDLKKIAIIANDNRDRIIEYLLDDKKFTNEEYEIFKLTYDISNLENQEAIIPEIKSILFENDNSKKINKKIKN